MSKELNGLKVAILVSDGFEQSEMTEPKKALEEAGAKVSIVSLKEGDVKGWKDTNWGDKFKVDVAIEKTSSNEFDALVLPGGVMNPDTLRNNQQAIAFIKAFVNNEKPIAAICHGPWTLINAGALQGKTVTSWASIKQDLLNAGANWVDKEFVKDGNLVTSRKPDDLPVFNKEMINLFSQCQPH